MNGKYIRICIIIMIVLSMTACGQKENVDNSQTECIYETETKEQAALPVHRKLRQKKSRRMTSMYL